jgi:putative two-component system response regulator
MAADVTGSHHERWDGDGYPSGLRGSAIPLSARIVALTDYYDVWRTSMVYRPEVLPRQEVIGRIKKLAGQKFDAVVAGAFLRGTDAVAQIEDEEFAD